LGYRDCHHEVDRLHAVEVDGVRFKTQVCLKCGGVWTADPSAPGRQPPFWRLVDAAGHLERVPEQEKWPRS
jgi:hypothetical protein